MENKNKNTKLLFLGGGSFLAFIILYYSLINGSFLDFIDSRVHGFFVSLENPLLSEIMIFVDIITDPNVLIVVTLLLAVILVYKKARKEAILFVGSIGVGGALIKILKDLFQIPRPSGAIVEVSSYGFPSGHTALGFIFFILLAFLISKTIEDKYKRKNLIILTSIIIFIIAFSRLYLGVHWFSDVLAGALLGLGVLNIAIYLYLRYKD